MKMSIYAQSTTSRLTSILKNRTSLSNSIDTLKEAHVNKVRFELTRSLKIEEVLSDVVNHRNYQRYEEFLSFLQKTELNDTEVINILKESRELVHLFEPKFSKLVDEILKFNCFQRELNVVNEFQTFVIDLLVAHNKFTANIVEHLISIWKPADDDLESWKEGVPSEKKKCILNEVNSILYKLVDLIPLAFDIIIETIEKLFPYYKKPPHVTVAYIYNVIALIDAKPVFQTNLIQLLFTKLLVFDMNAPKDDIEDADFERDEMDTTEADETNEQKFQMALPEAETLDLCLNMLMEFIKAKFAQNNMSNQIVVNKLFDVFMLVFEKAILSTHNPLHVQFVIFYFCSLKLSYAETFLKLLWHQVCDPNVGSRKRQVSISYIGSFIARAKFLPLKTLKTMLKEICSWAHQYIERCDSVKYNNSLKAHSVFHSVCQAIFYVIAFRSRHLTDGNKNLIFLQSLQLSSLVSCHLNPLRVCSPTIVQTFAGITRAYQLAYCHTVIEKNIRKKLATVYTNKSESVEECLETFFPFDPCLLKRTNEKINPLFLQYQQCSSEYVSDTPVTDVCLGKRERYESVTSENDEDDFLVEYKKQKIHHFNKTFTLGVYPGFHV